MYQPEETVSNHVEKKIAKQTKYFDILSHLIFYFEIFKYPMFAFRIHKCNNKF